MEITISVLGDGSADVRTSLGGYQSCLNEEHARIYANGLRDGYTAAAGKLGFCHGFDVQRAEG